MEFSDVKVSAKMEDVRLTTVEQEQLYSKLITGATLIGKHIRVSIYEL